MKLFTDSLFAGDLSAALSAVYVGALGRAADLAGRDYWENQLATDIAGGADPLLAIKKLAEDVTSGSEFASGIGSFDPSSAAGAAAIVEGIYGNLFARTPTGAETLYWLPQLMDGASSPAGMVVTILAGLQPSSADAQAFAFRNAAGQAFTQSVANDNFIVQAAQDAVGPVADLGSLEESLAITSIITNLAPAEVREGLDPAVVDAILRDGADAAGVGGDVDGAITGVNTAGSDTAASDQDDLPSPEDIEALVNILVNSLSNPTRVTTTLNDTLGMGQGSTDGLAAIIGDSLPAGGDMILPLFDVLSFGELIGLLGGMNQLDSLLGSVGGLQDGDISGLQNLGSLVGGADNLQLLIDNIVNNENGGIPGLLTTILDGVVSGLLDVLGLDDLLGGGDADFIFNALMGGDLGGLDSLTSLLGGDAGGLDSLTSLLGGDAGGLGDLLGGLGGETPTSDEGSVSLLVDTLVSVLDSIVDGQHALGDTVDSLPLVPDLLGAVDGVVAQIEPVDSLLQMLSAALGGASDDGSRVLDEAALELLTPILTLVQTPIDLLPEELQQGVNDLLFGLTDPLDGGVVDPTSIALLDPIVGGLLGVLGQIPGAGADDLVI